MRASWIPCDHDCFRSIHLAPHMINDHRGARACHRSHGLGAGATPSTTLPPSPPPARAPSLSAHLPPRCRRSLLPLRAQVSPRGRGSAAAAPSVGWLRRSAADVRLLWLRLCVGVNAALRGAADLCSPPLPRLRPCRLRLLLPPPRLLPAVRHHRARTRVRRLFLQGLIYRISAARRHDEHRGLLAGPRARREDTFP